jgi:hypothetical protein
MTDRIITGGDIDSYCTRCKLTLEHIVLAMVGGAVVKVKCKTCGSIHRFKGMPVVRPKSSRKEGVASKSFVTCQALWEAAVGGANGPELPYDMARSYRAGDVIVHSIFGKGVVQKTLFKNARPLQGQGENTRHIEYLILIFTRTLNHIIYKFHANRTRIRRGIVFERLFLPTCLPAGRYSGSMFL